MAPSVPFWDTKPLFKNQNTHQSFPFPFPSQVAYVVKKNGLLSKWQNILVGYGIPFGVILVSLAMNLYHYGG